MCTMNTFFQHRSVHKYTWCKDSLGQQSLIDFCKFSSDLFRPALHVHVKKCAELSTDHHLHTGLQLLCIRGTLRRTNPYLSGEKVE